MDRLHGISPRWWFHGTDRNNAAFDEGRRRAKKQEARFLADSGPLRAERVRRALGVALFPKSWITRSVPLRKDDRNRYRTPRAWLRHRDAARGCARTIGGVALYSVDSGNHDDVLGSSGAFAPTALITCRTVNTLYFPVNPSKTFPRARFMWRAGRCDSIERCDGRRRVLRAQVRTPSGRRTGAASIGVGLLSLRRRSAATRIRGSSGSSLVGVFMMSPEGRVDRHASRSPVGYESRITRNPLSASGTAGTIGRVT